MQVGEVVAERFVLEELIGSGGMGDVHRALDRPDRRVAQLRENAGLAQEPLVANGVSADGERYIASEWLEGEDLEQRLARGPLAYDACSLAARTPAKRMVFTGVSCLGCSLRHGRSVRGDGGAAHLAIQEIDDANEIEAPRAGASRKPMDRAHGQHLHGI